MQEDIFLLSSRNCSRAKNLWHH